MKLVAGLKAKLSRPTKLEKEIKNIVGFRPSNVFLYQTALVHKSALHDAKKIYKESNERLEFLGDAVLGAVIADYLFQKFPKKDEGFLTKIRSRIVSRTSLNKIAVEIGLQKLIISKLDRYSKTESIYGNAFEALIGAIYLDKGLIKTEQFILTKVLEPHVSLNKIMTEETNFKSRIIEWSQKEKQEITFEILEEFGEGRGKEFLAGIKINNELRAKGKARSKKKAEQLAAEKLCIELGIISG